MSLLADSFAATPAGYITGIFTPVAVAILAGVLVRYERAQARLWAAIKELNEANSTQSRALELLVQKTTDDRPQLARIPELAMTTNLLQDRLDRHEKWAQDEHDRLRDRETKRRGGKT